MSAVARAERGPTAVPMVAQAAGRGAGVQPRAMLRSVAPRRARRWPTAWLLLSPSLLALAAFTYWPLAQVAFRSIVVQRLAEPARFGLSNYARLFADQHFLRAALNNAAYAVGTILPSVALALGFALVLRESTRVNAVLRAMLVAPMMVPLVAVAAMFSFIFLPGAGLLDHHLAMLGIGATNWLGDPDLALGSLVAVTVWKNAGYYMLFFLAGLAGMPRELEEAARIDGAGRLARLRHVVLPMLGPTFGFVLPIALLNALVQIDHVVTTTRGGPNDATNLLLYYIYQQAQENYDAGLAAAATVATVACLLALTVGSLRRLERGIHYES